KRQKYTVRVRNSGVEITRWGIAGISRITGSESSVLRPGRVPAEFPSDCGKHAPTTPQNRLRIEREGNTDSGLEMVKLGVIWGQFVAREFESTNDRIDDLCAVRKGWERDQVGDGIL